MTQQESIIEQCLTTTGMGGASRYPSYLKYDPSGVDCDYTLQYHTNITQQLHMLGNVLGGSSQRHGPVMASSYGQNSKGIKAD